MRRAGHLMLVLALCFTAFPTFCLADGLWQLRLRYPKFRHWDYHFRLSLEKVARENCSKQIQDYFTNNRTTCGAPCACVISCMFAAISDELKTNMASATIVLGLAPTLLAFLAPSTAEVAVLAIERPVLTSILTLGETAILPVQAFTRVSVNDVVTTTISPSTRNWYRSLKRLSNRHALLPAAMAAAQYILAIAAAANTIQTSLALDLYTVVSFRCNSPFLPLSWNVICATIQAFAHLSLRMRLTRDAKTRRQLRSWREAAKEELVPCVFHDGDSWFEEVDRSTEPHFVADLLNWLVTLAVVGHIFFGVVVVSSLLLISTPQAVLVLIRYAASAMACRIILLIELGGIRMRRSSVRELVGGFSLSHLNFAAP